LLFHLFHSLVRLGESRFCISIRDSSTTVQTVNNLNVRVLILANRTNGCPYATMLFAYVVCDIYIVLKQCLLPNNCLNKQNRNGIAYGESNGHLTDAIT